MFSCEKMSSLFVAVLVAYATYAHGLTLNHLQQITRDTTNLPLTVYESGCCFSGDGRLAAITHTDPNGADVHDPYVRFLSVQLVSHQTVRLSLSWKRLPKLQTYSKAICVVSRYMSMIRVIGQFAPRLQRQVQAHASELKRPSVVSTIRCFRHSVRLANVAHVQLFIDSDERWRNNHCRWRSKSRGWFGKQLSTKFTLLDVSGSLDDRLIDHEG